MCLKTAKTESVLNRAVAHMRNVARDGDGLRAVILLAESNSGMFTVHTVTCAVSPMHVVGLASVVPDAVKATYGL